mmetsp:Transcript_13032/g.38302  ORF Transcript_13032/g.38302 Transcript_13032/m.38302 type:complete len:150 (-) Transcript_13032:286-735(-)
MQKKCITKGKMIHGATRGGGHPRCGNETLLLKLLTWSGSMRALSLSGRDRLNVRMKERRPPQSSQGKGKRMRNAMQCNANLRLSLGVTPTPAPFFHRCAGKEEHIAEIERAAPVAKRGWRESLWQRDAALGGEAHQRSSGEEFRHKICD